MYSKQETDETIFMNILLMNKEVSLEEIKNGLVFAGLWKETSNTMTNSIRALAISLNRQFEKYEMRFCARQLDLRSYAATEQAREFCEERLREKLYDEEGVEVGYIYQHPLSLELERMELV